MDEVARLLTLLALAGGALTLLGAAVAWFLEESRRIRRTLTQALGAPPQPLLIAQGRGAGIGFDLARARVCVTWDRGGWRLDYGLGELLGVELIVDRQVAARAFRDEGRKPLDRLADPQERVRVRFVFDDPTHPDFELDLWRRGDDAVRGRRMNAEQALHEANRWMARMDSLLRRPVARPPASAQPQPAATTRIAPPPPAAGPLFDDALDDGGFDDAPDDDDALEDDAGRVIN